MNTNIYKENKDGSVSIIYNQEYIATQAANYKRVSGNNFKFRIPLIIKKIFGYFECE